MPSYNVYKLIFINICACLITIFGFGAPPSGIQSGPTPYTVPAPKPALAPGKL